MTDVNKEETKKGVEQDAKPEQGMGERPANVMPPDGAMGGIGNPPVPEKMLIITENGIKTNGFNNIYELFGFIDIHVNPDRIKAFIMEKLQE